MGFHPTHFGMASACLAKGMLATLVWHLPGILGALTEEAAHTLQSHILDVKREAPRDVNVGGQQVQLDQEAGGGLHRGGLIPTDLGAHGWLALRGQRRKMVLAGLGWRGWLRCGHRGCD